MASGTSTSSVPPLTRERILAFLRADDTAELIAQADAVRRAACGETVHIRGIIEFSNCCARHCLYCGLRSDNRRAE